MAEPSTGLYFIGEPVVDLKISPANAQQPKISLGGSSCLGSLGAARAIKRNGLNKIRSFYMGSIPNDFFRDFFKNALKNEDVGIEYARYASNLLSLTAIGETKEQGRQFAFYGLKNLSEVAEIKIEDINFPLKEERQLFCIGSSVMTVLHVREAQAAYIRKKAQEGRIIYFDPNTRPRLINDWDEYRQRLLSIATCSSLVKVGEEDIIMAFPNQTHEDIAEWFLSSGSKALIITHGERGCTVHTQKGKHFCPVDTHPDILDTVGAGDNFNAGVLIAMARRGIHRRNELDALTMGDWGQIGHEANEIAFRHLLQINGIEL